MNKRDHLRRLTSRLARGLPISWDAEERAAETDEERGEVRQLRLVAAMGVLNQAIQSDAASEDLSASISLAKSFVGQENDAAKSTSPPEPSLAPGSRWASLEIFECIGGGGFGEVYRARDTRLDREVALKILLREPAEPHDKAATETRLEGEVVAEARLLARVHHPNVVSVYGADRIDGRIGIWMEFLRGETLHQILRERGVLDEREAALIGIDLCRALSAVHAAGITHQDVKLSNAMRAEGGRIVLMDFGLGREAEALRGRRKTRALSGTPLFMAPEVLRGGRSNARSDIYSLGVVLFSLVTGSLPVEASTLNKLLAKHERGERQHARDLRPDLSTVFVQVLHQALSPDPQSRFNTAGEVEQALLGCLGVRHTAEARRQDALVTVPHRLPEETDAFVGRENELAEMATRLDGEARLVTLLGPGGIGKTRLAVRYGRQSLTKWPGGVWFCDLTEARSREGVASAVAGSLGVPLGKEDPVEQLGHVFARRGRCLVILDNFEQVVAQAKDTLEPWLARAVDARFVVTSRERLDLRGEDVQVVEPLSIDSGVELFVDRARRLRAGFEPKGQEAESLRELVLLVESIPLAIELAAARVRVMTAGQVVARMRDRFRLLAGTGGGRHATLRATIDGSWEFLEPWEKAALAQCTVFEGGFTLEAAEQVLDLSAWETAPWMVDVVQSLVDKSLLRSWVPQDASSTEPEVRFGMFVSVQEYARAKLEDVDAIAEGAIGPRAARAAEQRHATWFASLGTDDAIESLDAHGGTARRRRLGRELENFVTACRRSIARGDWETAVATHRAAWSVLDLRGPLALGSELGSQILDAPLSRKNRAQLLTCLARAAQRSGRMGEAATYWEEVLTIHRELGDRRGEGRVLASLGTLPLNQGRIEEGRVQLEAALAVHREVGDRRFEGMTLGNLALMYQEARALEQARAHFEASLAIHREVGNRRSEGIVCGNLANLLREQGRMDEARPGFDAALAIHREADNRLFEGIVLGNLGELCIQAGEIEEARAHFEAALAIHREVGPRRFEGDVLDNLADLHLSQGRVEEARALYEAALVICLEIGNTRLAGIVLGGLCQLHLQEGRIALARERLAEGEALLREGEYWSELGKLVCTRAELEHQAGDLDAAHAALAEAEALAAVAQAGPDSELGRRLAVIRQSLADARLR